MFNENVVISLDIMLKGMFGSFVVAIILMILIAIAAKFFKSMPSASANEQK